MAPVVISFNDRTATPPIYVAGNFTEWQAVELSATLTKGEQGQEQYIYEKTFDLAPGSYQYKFRLGPGDWWVCDNQSPKDRDASGNENNVLVVEPEPVKPVASAAPAAPVVPVAPVAPAAAVAPVIDTKSSNTIPTVKATSNHASVTLPQQPEEQVPIVKAVETPQTQPAVQTNGFAKTTVESEEKPTKVVTPEITTKAANGHVATPAATEQAKSTQVAADAKVVTSQPASKSVDTATPAKPAEKVVDSKSTSVSSNPPKEKISEKKAEEPEKLSWFARIFLCGSSGKVALAAAVVSVPIVLAYFIQK